MATSPMQPLPTPAFNALMREPMENDMFYGTITLADGVQVFVTQRWHSPDLSGPLYHVSLGRSRMGVIVPVDVAAYGVEWDRSLAALSKQEVDDLLTQIIWHASQRHWQRPTISRQTIMSGAIVSLFLWALIWAAMS